jgi:hypothetical protein
MFPPPLNSYGDSGNDSVTARLRHRIQVEPFNLVATVIFFLAIIHTFLSSRLLAIAHRLERRHAERLECKDIPPGTVHLGARFLHFFGEVETVFGVWAVVLLVAISAFRGWGTAVHYLAGGVNYTEAIFVVVIMTLASSRPILKVAEAFMARIAHGLGGSITAWWFTILILGPVLGSFITEPAAMTIAALLLVRKFYELEPSPALKYGTIGLLFVNVSIGGTLTHFAAPPILMVAGVWNWGAIDMITMFGWKSVTCIVLNTTAYYLLFRREFAVLAVRFRILTVEERILGVHLARRRLEADWDDAMAEVDEELGGMTSFDAKLEEIETAMKRRLKLRYVERIVADGYEREIAEKLFAARFNEVKLYRLRRAMPLMLPAEKRASFQDPDWDRREDPVPAWVTVVHIGFMVWTILNAHYPAMFVPGLLFFLAFARVTSPYQNFIDLRSPLLVGFFLGGLLVHGGVQAWWIEPVLGSLSDIPLMIAAIIMTSFNDNAAITYLATLIPGITEGMKYAVVAGAVTGGGLTVIANAPNPAGQAILKGHFANGVSPLKLLAAAAGPTVVVSLIFLLL